MALGGGTFVTQNKVLPGAYINFVSAAHATSKIGDRGYAALPIELDWGIDGEVMTLEAGKSTYKDRRRRTSCGLLSRLVHDER